LSKLTELNKKAAVFAYNAGVSVAEGEYALAKSLVETEYKARLVAAEFRDLKNLLYVTASEAGVVSGDYTRKDKEEVEKREVKKRKVARPKLSAYVFDPGNQVFDPRRQGDLPRFLGQSKHPEYQDLLAEFEDLKLGVNLEDRPAALAAIRGFRAVAAPSL
jgi:hypothetical protein